MNARNALLGLALLAVGAAIGWVAHSKVYEVGRYQLAASAPSREGAYGAYLWCLDTATGKIVGEFRDGERVRLRQEFTMASNATGSSFELPDISRWALFGLVAAVGIIFAYHWYKLLHNPEEIDRSQG